MQCPVCRESLELQLGGLPIDRCQRCRVFWFDRLELEAFLSMVARLDPKRPATEIDMPSPALCPRCLTLTLESGSWRDIAMARRTAPSIAARVDSAGQAINDRWRWGVRAMIEE